MNLRPLFASLARKLLLMALDQGLKRALPYIYRRLDAELPYWLQHATNPTSVDLVIKESAAAVLHRDPKPYELELITLLYDPAKAVANASLARKRR